LPFAPQAERAVGRRKKDREEGELAGAGR